MFSSLNNGYLFAGSCFCQFYWKDIFVGASIFGKMSRYLSPAGSGDWTVYCPSLTSFIITFSYALTRQLWEHLLNFDWLVNQTFQPIVIYRRGNFVYHHRECTSIYRPLSYPFRSPIYLHLCYNANLRTMEGAIVS